MPDDMWHVFSVPESSRKAARVEASVRFSLPLVEESVQTDDAKATTFEVQAKARELGAKRSEGLQRSSAAALAELSLVVARQRATLRKYAVVESCTKDDLHHQKCFADICHSFRFTSPQVQL